MRMCAIVQNKKSRTVKKLYISFGVVLMMIILTSCAANTQNNKKIESKTTGRTVGFDSELADSGPGESDDDNNPEVTTHRAQSDESQLRNQKVAEQIISHKAQWLEINNEYSQRVSYDPVQASSLMLYPTDTKRTYELIIIYPLGMNVYAPVYYVNADSFQYIRTITDRDEYNNQVAFGSVYSNRTALAMSGVEDEYIYDLCDLAYEKEDEYFASIDLQVDDTIQLTGEDKLLYDNLLKALDDLEYFTYSNGIISKLTYVEYHDFGNGECKAIFHYVGTYNAYSIGADGYEGMSYNDEQILKNSTLTSFDWDPSWTDAKKQYSLKNAIINA